MYIDPIGTNPPSNEDRMPIWRVYSGDTLMLNTRLTLLDGMPVTDSNSKVTFTLSQTQFCEDSIWVGTWNDGITEVDPTGHPGLVKILIPDDIGDTLRRGNYRFSITVANRFGREDYTALVGNMLVEYAPGSPQHSIPYKEDGYVSG